MVRNLFDLPRGAWRGEVIDELVQAASVRVERIVSRGDVTPEGEWYDQTDDEWVCVLRGRARLQLSGPEELIEMGPGDMILLAAHRRHRVEWTDPDEATVWLAIHYSSDGA